jgi:hypothetical protein
MAPGIFHPRYQSSFGLISGPAPRSDQTMPAKIQTPPAGKLRWGGPSLAVAATSCSACSIQRFFGNSLACCAVALCAWPLTARAISQAGRSFVVRGEGCACLPPSSCSHAPRASASYLSRHCCPTLSVAPRAIYQHGIGDKLPAPLLIPTAIKARPHPQRVQLSFPCA